MSGTKFPFISALEKTIQKYIEGNNLVEVVRCKDCRWFENDGFHTNCKIMQFCVEAEDYCSRGEMRQDNTK